MECRASGGAYPVFACSLGGISDETDAAELYLFTGEGIQSPVHRIGEEWFDMENALIEAKELTFSYGEVPALEQISFEVRAGECIGLVGANGAGKSTLLKLMVGLLEGYEGTLSVGGIPVIRKNYPQIRRLAGYLFQDSRHQLFSQTVYEDVAFGPVNYGYSQEEVRKRVEHAMKMVHIEDLGERPVYQMSGGQTKLAALATLLAMEPELVLFDEPSAALDPKNRRGLMEIIRQMPATRLIASHDLDFIYDTCQRVILLYQGRIVGQGSVQEILTDEKKLQTYDLELPLRFSNK